MKKVESIDDLAEILKDGETKEFFIQLNYGVRSSKYIALLETKRFWVWNLVDDSEQRLTRKQLMDPNKTNIGLAIEKGALYYDD